MSLSPISARAIPGDYSPYDVGAADLSKAQSDLKQLSALKVTANDYKDANATHGWWGLFNGFSDKSAKQALISAGVAANRLTTTSFGKEKPFCTESNEQCWQQNRRAHLVLQGQ